MSQNSTFSAFLAFEDLYGQTTFCTPRGTAFGTGVVPLALLTRAKVSVRHMFTQVLAELSFMERKNKAYENLALLA